MRTNQVKDPYDDTETVTLIVYLRSVATELKKITKIDTGLCKDIPFWKIHSQFRPMMMVKDELKRKILLGRIDPGIFSFPCMYLLRAVYVC